MVSVRTPRTPLRRCCYGALLAFVGFFLMAALAYPGGNWIDPGASGFDPLRNFWSDLLRERALDGSSNALGAALARAGFGALALGLSAFWILAAGSFRHPLAARLLIVAGLVSSVATLGVALLPSDRFPTLHPVAALVAGGLGFGCVVGCALRSLLQWRGHRLRAVLALSLLAAAAANIVLFVRVAYFEVELTAAVPAVQKLATLLLLAWMSSVLARPGGVVEGKGR